MGGYNTFWIDPGNHMMEVNGEYRSSILTTPNGMPPARKAGAPKASGYPREIYDSYENRPLGERCIMGFGSNAGPPMLTNYFYNNDYYILQSPDAVVIQVELNHDARVIRLKGGHRTDGVRQWMGDSIGHFEGDTLVVETINIPQGQAFEDSWKKLKVTERFTRVSPTRINYRFTIEDPDMWDKPWGGEYDFAPMKGIVYEYACHEGNYALPAILAGARRQGEGSGGLETGQWRPVTTGRRTSPKGDPRRDDGRRLAGHSAARLKQKTVWGNRVCRQFAFGLRGSRSRAFPLSPPPPRLNPPPPTAGRSMRRAARPATKAGRRGPQAARTSASARPAISSRRSRAASWRPWPRACPTPTSRRSRPT